MRKFIIYLFLFSLPIFVITFVSETYLRNKNTLYKEKLKGLLAEANFIEVLILGNSHAFHGIDPNQFDKYAYNMAMVRQSIYYDRRITMKYIDRFINLKYVFISVDYHSLYFSSQGARNNWIYKEYGIKYKNQDYQFNNWSYFLFTYNPKITLQIFKNQLSQNIKIKNSRLKVVDFNVPRGVNIFDSISKGWICNEGSNLNELDINNIKERANHFNEMVVNSNEKDEIINDLESFINELKNRNIQPILITLPCYNEFNYLLDKTYLLRNRLDIDELCEKYNVEYWDYLEEPFPQEFFFNSDHLNKRGAKKISIILNERLNKINK